MPKVFRKYPKTRTIIDCTEVFIERPSSLLARQQTYSSYKHHNTAKWLVAITPFGSISYVSDAWGGRASDKHIVNNSGEGLRVPMAQGKQGKWPKTSLLRSSTDVLFWNHWGTLCAGGHPKVHFVAATAGTRTHAGTI